MQVCSPERHLLRPLLNTPKEEILKFLKRKKIKYRIDQSNSDTRFSRNLLRNKVIPMLRRINNNVENTLLDFTRNIKDLDNFMDMSVKKWIRQNNTKQGIPLNPFLALPAVMQKTLLSGLYVKTSGSITNFNQRHLDQILKTLEKRRTGIKKEFGDNHFIVIKRAGAANRRFIAITSVNKISRRPVRAGPG